MSFLEKLTPRGIKEKYGKFLYIKTTRFLSILNTGDTILKCLVFEITSRFTKTYPFVFSIRFLSKRRVFSGLRNYLPFLDFSLNNPNIEIILDKNLKFH